MFSTYLVLAVVSEMSHASDSSTCELNSSLHAKLQRFRSQFLLDHRSNWKCARVPEVIQVVSQLSPSKMVQFFHDCRGIFFLGNWKGPFGGRPWANIAALGEQYWCGEVTSATFVDRMFDLRHNTGAVFNKHAMVYDQYNGKTLDRQLNLKRQVMSVSQKFVALTSCHSEVNDQITSFYEEGNQKGVWNE